MAADVYIVLGGVVSGISASQLATQLAAGARLATAEEQAAFIAGLDTASTAAQVVTAVEAEIAPTGGSTN